ncbi:DUF7373 family lipoprotein [Mycobacterium adipatum]|uniref:DUF7373 family lipoprotein n=1 Tax=Mycobacterium adipatum TaxID=1682113 RepID=UPI0012E81440|nr:hypothetical protein [Mycobacterium adipatum]
MPALVVIAVCLAGCSNAVDGTAQQAAGPAPDTVDVALLDPGNYSTEPLDPMGAAEVPAAGALLEAVRMADFVVGPWDVDPALVEANPFGMSPGAMPLKGDPSVLQAITVSEVAEAAGQHNYVNGFATSRQVKGQKVLFNVVLRMADPQSATAAAAAMAQAAQDNPVELTPPVTLTRIAIPGHPQANALTHSYPEYGTEATWHAVNAFTAHGPYVLMQRAQSTESSDAAAALVSRTLDLQGPRIDEFVATDPAQFPTLPRDASGLLAKALPVVSTDINVNNNATFGAHAALHYQSDPVHTGAKFSDAGVDVVVHAADWVYQTRDEAAAQQLVAASIELLKATGSAADPVPNMPGSHCIKVADQGFSCTSAAERYVFDVFSAQLPDAHQQMAAQYIMLTAE